MAPRKRQRQQQEPSTIGAPTIEDRMRGQTIEEHNRWLKIEGKPVLGNRIFDLDALEKLGVLGEVTTLIDNVSMRRFFFPTSLAFVNLTKEFLCTLVVNKRGEMGEDYYSMSFKLFGKKYSLKRHEFSSIFGFYDNVTNRDMVMGMGGATHGPNETWREVSTQSRHNKDSQAKDLKSLALWVVHRMLASSIKARDNGVEKVNQVELVFIQCMLSNTKICSSLFFIDHLLNLGNKGSGVIRIGSYVTMIAQHVGAMTPSNIRYLSKEIPIVLCGIPYFEHTKTIRLGGNFAIDGNFTLLIGEHVEERRIPKREALRRPPTQEASTSRAPPPPPKKSKKSFEARVFKKLKSLFCFMSHIHGEMVELQKKNDIAPCAITENLELEWDFTSDEEEGAQEEEEEEEEEEPPQDPRGKTIVEESSDSGNESPSL